MPLYPPQDYSATASSLPFAAGTPRIQPVTYDSVRGELVRMLGELQGQAGAISSLPVEVRPQFEARAAAITVDLESLLQQLEDNKGGDIRTIMSFDAARGKLQQALVNFYEAYQGSDNIALRGLGETSERSKYLWWAGGAFVIAIGAIGIAVMMDKPKRGKSAKLGNILQTKFKRAIPAK